MILNKRIPESMSHKSQGGSEIQEAIWFPLHCANELTTSEKVPSEKLPQLLIHSQFFDPYFLNPFTKIIPGLV